MRLFRVFLEHEWVTQWRSARFRGFVAVYAVVACAPAAIVYLISGRMSRVIGPAGTNSLLLSEHPLLTALFAAAIAIDAFAREREEGSFSVLGVANVSSTGYLMRRWIAVVTLSLPVSLIPTAASAALAIHTRETLPLLAMFADGWLLYVLPSLLVSSALAIALGTITGRTVLAIIFGAVLITVGIGVLNSMAFFAHLNFSGPDALFAGGAQSIQKLIWTARGYWAPDVPSDAAFPLRSEMRTLPSRAGVTTAMAVVLLAASAFYLRRTRPDLRPWQIPETHQLRTLLRTMNRIREEYAPDAGSSTADRLVFVVALLLGVVLFVDLAQRQKAFAALAAERYAAETIPAVPTGPSVLIEAMRIDGEVTLTGHVRSRATAQIRNSGARAERHLSFMLNPMLRVKQLAAERGVARGRQLWERLDVDVDPPLAPGELRALTFDLAGAPAQIEFALQGPGSFGTRWTRYRDAKEEIYLSDLSQSTLTPDATEVRMNLGTGDIAPVLRYSPWTLKAEQEQDEGFLSESIEPPAALEIRFRHPYTFAADTCGIVARSEIAGRCTTGLVSYGIHGGPLARRAVGSQATLAYIPAHERIAGAQAASLASSIRLAAEAWPGLALPPRLVFIERPSERRQRAWFSESVPSRTIMQIGSHGGVFFVPETIFSTTKALDPNVFAAAIISGTLRSRRRVVPDQAFFFARFFSVVALERLGMRGGNAVEPGTGRSPDTTPLLNRTYSPDVRMAKVLASLQYRVGANHFTEGISDFVNGGRQPGTAKELIEDIGRSAGVDLSRVYAGYFEGDALPELTLADITFRRAGPSQWEVRGIVKNNATGEAVVPIALRTSAGSLWQSVHVDSHGGAAFRFTTPGEPRAVQLDPDGVCYRHAAIGLVDNVDYRGAS